jgi:succinyl-CoA synthetase beta subunit
MDKVQKAVARGLTALNEYDAKCFLSGFGISVPREKLAQTAEEAATTAATIGFPVALKAAGTTLFHKSDVGGVSLNLKSEPEVMDEGRRLLRIPGCEAVLVQEMVQGDRELVCGLTRDPQLGACVMFGLGGIFTETLDDAVFRIAPIATSDALEMLREIRSAKILESFRGQSAADTEALTRILVALGEISLRYEAIRAIDLNPIKIRPNGSPVAVDALISLLPQAARQG